MVEFIDQNKFQLMGETNTFSGQPIFSQMIILLDKDKIDNLVEESGTGHDYKKNMTLFSIPLR